MLTRYRIVDRTDDEILAQSLNSTEEAQEVLYFLKQEYPSHDLEVESYTTYTVKGLGRDPDLH